MENKDYKKLYEEALERAKVVNKGTEDYNIVTTIFPELKESEDEIIRKELIEFVDINTLSTDERHDRWIAWLEKQGEQKPTWSEEDEEMLDRLTEYFELGIGCFFDENECNEAQDWLKSLKERIEENTFGINKTKY